MTQTVLVRPRRGLILAGIPQRGAEIPKALADEWIADQLVERIEAVEPSKPVRRRTTRRSTARKGRPR